VEQFAFGDGLGQVTATADAGVPAARDTAGVVGTGEDRIVKTDVLRENLSVAEILSEEEFTGRLLRADLDCLFAAE